jgi:hypothetical protein
MKKIVVLSFLAFWVGTVCAQDYAFKVIALKGNVSIAGQALKVGAVINSNQTVVLAEGAYLGLAHKSGKTHEINKAGTYLASEMETAVSKKNQGNVYMAMVVNELTGNSTEVNRKPKTGSVERALTKEPIGIQLDKSSIFYPKKPVAISWYLKDQNVEKMMSGDQFRIAIVNLFKDEIASEITKAQHAVFDLSNVKFDSENTGLVYKISSLKNPSRIISFQYSLQPCSEELAQKIEAEMEQSGFEDTPLGNLMLANLFEENGLYPNAKAFYLRAIELAPDSQVFVDQYQAFLDRKLFSRAARSAN